MQLLLPAETQLVITMLKQAISTSLYYTGHPFSMGKMTTGGAILEVCSTLQEVLGHTCSGSMPHPPEVVVFWASPSAQDPHPCVLPTPR